MNRGRRARLNYLKTAQQLTDAGLKCYIEKSYLNLDNVSYPFFMMYIEFTRVDVIHMHYYLENQTDHDLSVLCVYQHQTDIEHGCGCYLPDCLQLPSVLNCEHIASLVDIGRRISTEAGANLYTVFDAWKKDAYMFKQVYTLYEPDEQRDNNIIKRLKTVNSGDIV